MDHLQRFQALVKLISAQLELYGQLVSVEWQEEKRRLQHLAFFILLGVMCVGAFLFSLGVLLIALSWDTDYRLFVITTMVGVYGLGAVACFYWVRKMLGNLNQSFSATRMEIISDFQVIRRQL